MKKLFLLAFVAVFSFHSQAQKQTQDPNRGNFYVVKNTSKGTERINVNFVLQPAPFTDLLHVDLNTPNPMAMTVKIIDAAGTLYMAWTPTQVSSAYEHQFDIANLKPGKYKLEILGDANNKLHTVNFEKQNATTQQNSNSK